jgi:RNA polymerase sigma-70 factor, ECF subfamily
MAVSGYVRAALFAEIPELRALAISLCGSRDRGDDLVHTTLLGASAPGAVEGRRPELAAWLFAMLRNRFPSKERRHVDESGDRHDDVMPGRAQLDSWPISADLVAALERLPIQQRDAVILVGAAGLTIAEAASVCGCEPGTIKSRLNRGRARLAELMAGVINPGESRRAAQATTTIPVSANGSFAAGATPGESQPPDSISVRAATNGNPAMSNQAALWSWVNRANIERYRRMLATHLTPIERQFIEQRIGEEEAELRKSGEFVETQTVGDRQDQAAR